MNFLGSDLTNAPPVMQPPQSFLSTMEEYVKDAPRAASSKTLYLKDVPVSDEILFLKCWNSLDIEMRIYLILFGTFWNRRMRSDPFHVSSPLHHLTLRRKFMRMPHLEQNLFQNQHLLQLHQLNQLVIFWWVSFSKGCPEVVSGTIVQLFLIGCRRT
jgi:hypothetical protein